jgi:hypothetical protein
MNEYKVFNFIFQVQLRIYIQYTFMIILMKLTYFMESRDMAYLAIIWNVNQTTMKIVV